jgi:hypothetical protein
LYLKNRIIFFFISLFRFVFYFCPSIFFISVYFVLFSLVSFYFVFISLISFRFVSFLLISFRFVSFRFVFVDFVSSRFVSFLFRFALYRYPFNTLYCFLLVILYKNENWSELVQERISEYFVIFYIIKNLINKNLRFFSLFNCTFLHSNTILLSI